MVHVGNQEPVGTMLATPVVDGKQNAAMGMRLVLT